MSWFLGSKHLIGVVGTLVSMNGNTRPCIIDCSMDCSIQVIECDKIHIEGAKKTGRLIAPYDNVVSMEVVRALEESPKNKWYCGNIMKTNDTTKDKYKIIKAFEGGTSDEEVKSEYEFIIIG